MSVADEWSSRGLKLPYRTRLIGRLAFLLRGHFSVFVRVVHGNDQQHLNRRSDLNRYLVAIEARPPVADVANGEFDVELASREPGPGERPDGVR